MKLKLVVCLSTVTKTVISCFEMLKKNLPQFNFSAILSHVDENVYTEGVSAFSEDFNYHSSLKTKQ